MRGANIPGCNAAELERLTTVDPRIVVLDADLARANGTLGLRKKFPDRALDAGLEEQNMASVAAGWHWSLTGLARWQR